MSRSRRRLATVADANPTPDGVGLDGAPQRATCSRSVLASDDTRQNHPAASSRGLRTTTLSGT